MNYKKTPEEIIAALRHCAKDEICAGCPMRGQTDCVHHMEIQAANLIEELLSRHREHEDGKIDEIATDTSNKPLTIEELIKMQDKAVWVQPKGDPLNGHWGVVEGAGASKGKKYLYLWGDSFPYLIDEHDEAFTTRQMKGV